MSDHSQIKNRYLYLHTPVFVLICIILESCLPANKKPLFTSLPISQSGIDFINEIHDSDSSHSFINEFGYMGGGVGIGDFNNDGLKDIFFTGNQVSSRLYLNKGNLQFEDITESAGLKTEVWCTGVSIIDINQDGYDDIYICVFGKDLLHRAKNLLYINQQDLTFKDEAMAYGLADTGYSTQAAFLDFDRDGDLDMYLTNYLLSSKNTNTVFPRDKSGRSPANDRLYQNNGMNDPHPIFIDVTISAGIKEDGYGLGISVTDVNKDGWADIYIANDFVSNDNLWMNNGDGTFANQIDKALKHQSYSSMGSDAADINNDGLPDIMSLDMLPEDNERKKTSFSFMNYDRYSSERAMGYEPEFMRNMLQLNNGSRTISDASIPFFSEIGQLAGIEATDWSWSVLMADFDHDGWKDIYITNGIGRDFINADFLEFSQDIFSSMLSREEQENKIRNKLSSLNHINLSNYLYINNQDLTFKDETATGGMNELSMSNGAAYADLDNDGDLDLIVNNINKHAFIYINTTNQKSIKSDNHYISIQLEGDRLNKQGFGTKVTVYNHGMIIYQEQYPVRGYFSSVDQKLNFGLGHFNRIDSIMVLWPDGKKQILKQIPSDTLLVISWKDAIVESQNNSSQTQTLFTEISSTSQIKYKHIDNSFNDFSLQRLLPQKYSQLGPFITTGDINNDGSDDFFIGGGINSSGQIFFQIPDNEFKSAKLIDSIKHEEDMDCLLFDADNDGDQDLLITSGDIQYVENSIYYKPRLYINDGKGNFKLKSNAIPDSVRTIAGCVASGDFDGDGDLDLFIGGRVSKTYPTTPKSFLLENTAGTFKDVTSTVCPTLQRAGMITAAVWTDLDQDHQIDLVIAGEWMPIRFFKNIHGFLQETTTASGLTQTNGMWRSLCATDLDKDGDIDLVAGNLGLNCMFRSSASHPMQLLATDLDGNGSIDPLLFYFIKSGSGKKLLPAFSRSQLSEQVPSMKKRFLLHRDFAQSDYNAIFRGVSKKNIEQWSCDETRSCYFENLGNGIFTKHILPIEAQFSPINAIICEDMDGDGIKDILLAGNEYQAEVKSGRFDASYGCFLKGDHHLVFKSIPPLESGFIIDGDVKDLALLPLSNGNKIVLVAINNDSLRTFLIVPPR